MPVNEKEYKTVPKAASYKWVSKNPSGQAGRAFGPAVFIPW